MISISRKVSLTKSQMKQPASLIIVIYFLALFIIIISCSSEGGADALLTTTTEEETTLTSTPPTTTSQTLTTTTTRTNTLTIDPALDPTTFYVKYIVLSPDTATISAGSCQFYTVVAYDYGGNSFEVTRDCDFFITKEAGGIWIYNEYISEHKGTWEVTADYWNPVDGTEFWRDQATLIVTE